MDRALSRSFLRNCLLQLHSQQHRLCPASLKQWKRNAHNPSIGNSSSIAPSKVIINQNILQNLCKDVLINPVVHVPRLREWVWVLVWASLRNDMPSREAPRAPGLLEPQPGGAALLSRVLVENMFRNEKLKLWVCNGFSLYKSRV